MEFSEETIKKCPKCKEEQELNNSYCYKCGYKFTRFIALKQLKCPKCGQFQYLNNEFCVNCGQNLSETNDIIECPQCGEKILSSCEVCPNCGYDLINKKSFEIPKPRPVPKSTKFKRDTIFLSNFDFNLKFCPKCNCELLLDQKFCHNCGLNVEDIEKVVTIPEHKISKSLEFRRRTIFLSNFDFNLKLCPKCNSELLFDDAFCYNCGEKLTINESTIQDKDIKSKYDPSFKIAYVLYLEELRKNPKKEFSQKIANNYKTSLDELKKQAIDDQFIELESPLMVASTLKITEIKEVLKNNNLKVSGKKEELIERLGESLSKEELEKYFKCENYLLTDAGFEFIENNNFIIYINKNTEVSKIVFPSDYISLFDEHKYSSEQINEILINYFKNKVFNELNQKKCDNFKDYSNAISSILITMGNLKNALVMCLNVFLFEINNFSNDLQPNPSETKLKSKELYKLFDLLSKLDLTPKELSRLFAASCRDFPFNRLISDEDSWNYLVKILRREDLKNVSKEINKDYSFD